MQRRIDPPKGNHSLADGRFSLKRSGLNDSAASHQEVVAAALPPPRATIFSWARGSARSSRGPSTRRRSQDSRPSM
jgi:hypothetical protein